MSAVLRTLNGVTASTDMAEGSNAAEFAGPCRDPGATRADAHGEALVL